MYNAKQKTYSIRDSLDIAYSKASFLKDLFLSQ